MKEKNSYGALYLDAPLQSWGYQSRYDDRTSLSYPTRSGIIGMICAALGIDREDSAELEDVNTILAGMDVAVFQAGRRLVDYHTVGGGYATKSDSVPVKSDGKTHSPVQTHREYLSDAKFGVVVEGEVSFVERIGEALDRPRWGIWFGRKSCIPAVPVWHGSYADAEGAWAKLRNTYESRTGRELKEKTLRFVREVRQFDEGTDTINDMPVDFSVNSRKFLPRRVCVTAREMD